MSNLYLASVPSSRLDEHLSSVTSAWANSTTVTGNRFHVCCNKLICMLKALITLSLSREDFDFIHGGIRNWLFSSADQTNPNKSIRSFYRGELVNWLLKIKSMKLYLLKTKAVSQNAFLCQELLCSWIHPTAKSCKWCGITTVF